MITTICLVLILSIIFQLTAAIYALRLIKLTGFKYSWILISIALLLMSVRRIIPLYFLFSKTIYLTSLPNEIIGLILSFLMLLGVRGIKPVFVERQLAENKIKTLLTEKEYMLQEVHHRIKNSMNTIQCFLSLQSATLKDRAAVTALEDAASRVKSMMVLYNKLYDSPDFMKLSIKDYLPTLIDEILINFPNSRSVKVEKDIDDIVLDTKTLQPLGIIINELLTNIMKYAFTGKNDCLINISVKLVDKNLRMSISDNGIGMPESVSFENSSGFGLMLIGILTKQLNGTIKIERGHGTRIILDIAVL
jgi:two-component sensor histidine kinase